MISEVNIISGKASITTVNRAGGSGRGSESLRWEFRGQKPLRTFLGTKEHLNQLEIDLNTAKIIPVQDYKSTKPSCVKAKSQAGNI